MKADKGAKCFIATVAYGSELAWEVECLRRFRDNQLSTTAFGRNLINLYNRIGPIAARHIASRPKGRSFTKALLSPIVTIINRRV